VAAGALLTGSAHANEQIVKLQTTVSSADLDLNQPADAHELYRRLQKAARALCDNGPRTDVRSLIPDQGCTERTLARAVQSVDRPQLTMIYLETHTLRGAASRGIEVPSLMVAK
jgi:UrcA family protein